MTANKAKIPDKSMKQALGASLLSEERAVNDRFSKADEMMNNTEIDRAKPANIKPIHEKVTRDSFTMPSGDYELIAKAKEKCLKASISVTKSEIVRAGLHVLDRLSQEALKQLMQSLEKVKTGRPK